MQEVGGLVPLPRGCSGVHRIGRDVSGAAQKVLILFRFPRDTLNFEARAWLQ